MSFKYLLIIIGLIIAALLAFFEESVSQPINIENHILHTSFENGGEAFIADLKKDGKLYIINP